MTEVNDITVGAIIGFFHTFSVFMLLPEHVANRRRPLLFFRMCVLGMYVGAVVAYLMSPVDWSVVGSAYTEYDTDFIRDYYCDENAEFYCFLV